MHETQILLGKFSEAVLDNILKKSSDMNGISDRVKFLSDRFLGVAYMESTLAGGRDIPEILVVNLEGIDCFTFIDYVEAMRMSHSFSDFLENLVRVRYKSGDVSFTSRKHFFTDWASSVPASVNDITGEIAGMETGKSLKVLNLNDDGTYYLPGIEPIEREISYIPSSSIDERVLEKITTGDYVGIYSHAAGIDVSHVGIFIRDGSETYMRHASSQAKIRKVIDEDFRSYVAKTPGIVVLRPV
jgi:hypothetical protein